MHTPIGMQTKQKLPYFADAQDARHEPESRQALFPQVLIGFAYNAVCVLLTGWLHKQAPM